MSACCFKNSSKQIEDKLFISCEECETQTSRASFHWPDCLMTQCTGQALFPSSTSKPVHRAHGLWSTKSLTHATASPDSCISNCLNLLHNAQLTSVSAFDKIWLGKKSSACLGLAVLKLSKFMLQNTRNNALCHLVVDEELTAKLHLPHWKLNLFQKLIVFFRIYLRWQDMLSPTFLQWKF